MNRFNSRTNFIYYLTHAMDLAHYNLTQVSDHTDIPLQRLKNLLTGKSDPTVYDMRNALQLYYSFFL